MTMPSSSPMLAMIAAPCVPSTFGAASRYCSVDAAGVGEHCQDGLAVGVGQDQRLHLRVLAFDGVGADDVDLVVEERQDDVHRVGVRLVRPGRASLRGRSAAGCRRVPGCSVMYLLDHVGRGRPQPRIRRNAADSPASPANPHASGEFCERGSTSWRRPSSWPAPCGPWWCA